MKGKTRMSTDLDVIIVESQFFTAKQNRNEAVGLKLFEQFVSICLAQFSFQSLNLLSNTCAKSLEVGNDGVLDIVGSIRRVGNFFDVQFFTNKLVVILKPSNVLVTGEYYLDPRKWQSNFQFRCGSRGASE